MNFERFLAEKLKNQTAAGWLAGFCQDGKVQNEIKQTEWVMANSR